MSQPAHNDASLSGRIKHELRSYAFVSTYLFICFSVILFYEAALSDAKDADLLSHSLALGKALVIGKFVLIGEALRLGSRLEVKTLAHRITLRALLFLALLVILTLVEELVVGLVHGQGVAATLVELAERPWPQSVAPILLMLLILVPLVSTLEINRALGEGRLQRLLTGQPDQQNGH